MSRRYEIDTPHRLAEVAAIEGMVVIRRLGGVWHAGLPWSNRGRGRAYPYASWSEAMREVPHV